MKKQIIAAAVAASVSAVALADVSISGAAQVNINKDLDNAGQPTVTHDVDIKVTGKSGDTTFVVDLENTSSTADLYDGTKQDGDALQVKNTYMTTDLSGIKVKAGTWYNGDSNLNNAKQQSPRAEFSTGLGSVNAKFAMEPDNTLYEMHLGADLAGVKVNYEQENQDNHKIISVAGSLAGVDFAYTDSRSDNATGLRLETKDDTVDADVPTGNNLIAADVNNEQNMVVSTNVGGMKIEYQKMTSKAGTSSDGFFGEFAQNNLLEADGFGITTSLAGNTVQIRNYKTLSEVDTGSIKINEASSALADNDDIDAAVEARNTKIIVTRPLASGATAEITYVTGDGTDSMDLEFRMKF